jgi:hypothetical protein
MPYVTCPNCAMPAYTAARWTTIDACPSCDAPLAGARRRAQSVPPLSAAASSSISTTTSSVGTMGSASTASGMGVSCSGVSMAAVYPPAPAVESGARPLL